MFDAASENGGYRRWSLAIPPRARLTLPPGAAPSPWPPASRPARCSSPPTSPAPPPPRSRLTRPSPPCSRLSPTSPAFPPAATTGYNPAPPPCPAKRGVGSRRRRPAQGRRHRAGLPQRHKDRRSYDRAYANTAAAPVPNGRVSLASFTPVAGGSLAPADLLRVAKAAAGGLCRLFRRCPCRQRPPHTGEVRRLSAPASAPAPKSGTEVLAGSPTSLPRTRCGLSASDPPRRPRPTPGLFQFSPGDTGPFQAGDLNSPPPTPAAARPPTTSKGLALGAVVCLKNDAGEPAPFRRHLLGGRRATWADPSTSTTWSCPPAAGLLRPRPLDTRAAQLTAQLYASSTQIDGSLPRGACLVTEAKSGDGSSTLRRQLRPAVEAVEPAPRVRGERGGQPLCGKAQRSPPPAQWLHPVGAAAQNSRAAATPRSPAC